MNVDHIEKIKRNKKEFIGALRSTGREGIEELIEFLSTTNFFVSPASARYHGAFDGGLCEHSLYVMKRLAKKVAVEGMTDTMSEESVIIVALLHDICKIELYIPESRNRKNKDGKWESYPCYTYNQELPTPSFPHGVLSFVLAERFIDLTEHEKMCICWHMGMEDNPSGFSAAVDQYPPVLLVHTADFEASRLDEVSGLQEDKVRI